MGVIEAIKMYEIHTANVHNELLVNEKDPKWITGSVLAMKNIGNIAVEITNAYAEFAQSNKAHALMVFLTFLTISLIFRGSD